MKKIELKENSIIFTIQKKKLFGGISEKVVEIFLEDIKLVSKEMFNGMLNSSCIFLKNGNEQFVSLEELEEKFKLDEMLELLMSKKQEYGYRMQMLDIETMETTEI